MNADPGVRAHLVVTALAAAMLAPASAPAVGQEEAAVATVRAQVTLGDGTPVAATVRLVVDDGSREVHADIADTDTTGRATFSSVPSGAGLHARAWADFEGATYGSDVVLVDGDEVEIGVTVYPVTDQGRPLHVDVVHLIVQAETTDTLRVLQFVTVLNTGEAAFAGGPTLADGRRAGLVIPLPSQASNVRSAPFPTAADALSAADAEIGSDRVLDARPVPPGGRQVAVTYDLELSGGPLTLSMTAPYPVQLVNLLIGGPAAAMLELTSPLLQPAGTQPIGGEAYDLWSAEALQPATELVFTIGPPAIRLAPYHWAVIGLGIALLAVVGASLHGGGSERLQQERLQELTERIARLDLDHEQGRLDGSEYFLRRAAELERLTLLEQATRGAAAEQ